MLVRVPAVVASYTLHVLKVDDSLSNRMRWLPVGKPLNDAPKVKGDRISPRHNCPRPGSAQAENAAAKRIQQKCIMGTTGGTHHHSPSGTGETRGFPFLAECRCDRAHP